LRVTYLAVTRKNVQRDRSQAPRPARQAATARRPGGLPARVVLWLLLLSAELAAFFFVGYLIGARLIGRVR
jgi:hypothetical protein